MMGFLRRPHAPRVRMLPGLNPAFRDASGLPTPEALQTICWAAPRWAKKRFGTLIALCELESPNFQRHRPGWELDVDRSRFENLLRREALERQRDIYSMSEFIHLCSCITGDPKEGNSDIMRWIVSCAEIEFDSLYKEELKSLHRNSYTRGWEKQSFEVLVSDVRRARYTMTLPCQSTLDRLGGLSPHTYMSKAKVAATEEAFIYARQGSEAKDIATSLGMFNLVWPRIPWLFDALERAVTTLLCGGRRCEVGKGVQADRTYAGDYLQGVHP